MVKLDDGWASLVITSPTATFRRQDAPECMTSLRWHMRRALNTCSERSGYWKERVRAVVVPEERALDIDSELDMAFAEFLKSGKKMSQNLFDLKDQVALITGGSGVLGMVFARALADQGAKIVVADINEERCNASAAEITKESGKACLGVLLDVSDPKAVAGAVGRVENEFGRIDILINNAAAQPQGMFAPLEEYSVEVWNRIMAVNLTGQFLMAQATAPIMLRQKRGSIINISSVVWCRGAKSAYLRGLEIQHAGGVFGVQSGSFRADSLSGYVLGRARHSSEFDHAGWSISRA